MTVSSFSSTKEADSKKSSVSHFQKIKMKIFNDSIRNRVEFLDERFYQMGDNYYPSVTTILEAYPKGKRFEQWLKDVGNSADDIVERAANQGSNVHIAIEKLVNGEEIQWHDYTLDEWKMILKFQDFFNQVGPEVIGAEITLVSEKIGVGGTIDLVCMIKGERWLIDTKTSGDIYDNHFVQLATYAVMWNEANPDMRIERIGALHLRAKTRGPSRDGKNIQGEGWKIEEPTESPAELFEVFKHVKALWHRLHPNDKPMNMVLPSLIKLPVSKRTEPVKVQAMTRKEVSMPFGEAI